MRAIHWLSDWPGRLRARQATYHSNDSAQGTGPAGAAALPLGRERLLLWWAVSAFFAFLSASATAAGIHRVAPAWFAGAAAAALEGSILLFSYRLSTVVSATEWRRCFVVWLVFCLASAYFSYAGADSVYEQHWAAQTTPVFERDALRHGTTRLQHALLPLRITILSRLSQKEAALDTAIAALDFRERAVPAAPAATRRWRAGEREQLTSQRSLLEATRRGWGACTLRPEDIIGAATPAAGRVLLEQQYETFVRQWTSLPTWLRTSLPRLPAPPRWTDPGFARVATRQDDPLLGPLQRLTRPTGLERLWFGLALGLEFLPFALLWTGAVDPEHRQQLRRRRRPRSAVLPGVDPVVEAYHRRCRQVTFVDQSLAGWTRAAQHQQVADAELQAALQAGSENVGLQQLAMAIQERVALTREHLRGVGVPEAEWPDHLERLGQPLLAALEASTRHLEGDALRVRWRFAASLAADLEAIRPEIEPLGPEFAQECREELEELLR